MIKIGYILRDILIQIVLIAFSLNILLLLNGIKCEKEYHMRDWKSVSFVRI